MGDEVADRKDGRMGVKREGAMPTKEHEIGWHRLKCNACGVSQRFVAVVHLITRQGGGTTGEPAGYQCAQCHGDVDMARMIQLNDLERKRAELKALQEQVGPPSEPTPAPR